MANNSFLLKGWLVSLIAVILALTKDTIVATQLTYFSFILLIPVFAFWYLDAFFLHKERCFIKLYEWVTTNRQTSNEHLYNLNYRRFENQVDSIWKIMRSKTLRVFYGIIVIILLILALHNIIV
jgi:hypothetical protein